MNIFYGTERRFKVDENYSQMKHIGKFIGQMRKKYPDVPFKALGYELDGDTMAYSLGMLNVRPDINEKITEVKLPDGGWEDFSCPFNDKGIQGLYDRIWADGALDYEIETIDGDVFEVSVHRAPSTPRPQR